MEQIYGNKALAAYNNNGQDDLANNPLLIKS